MERRGLSHPTPTWTYLRKSELAAGTHLASTASATSLLPGTPPRRRRGPRRYELAAPAATAPWAGSMASSLGCALGVDELGRTALTLCQASLQPRSYTTYASALTGFFEFCHDQAAPPLEVTPVHICKNVAWIGLQGTVCADSLQPYLSAINRFLTDHERAPVALGPLVSDVRAGLKNSQRDMNPAPARLPLPAPVALAILEYAEDLLPTLRWTSPSHPGLAVFRAMVAVLVNYTFFCRGEYGVSMLTRDLSVDDSTITLFLRKVKGRSSSAAHHLPLLRIPVSALPRLAHLLSQYFVGRKTLALANNFAIPDRLWTLHPGEAGASWSAATLSAWLSSSCALVEHAPPPGFTWSSHSLRKGAASAANSLNVGLTKIRYMGGWAKDSHVVHDYIDPTMPPTPAAALFFGHLLLLPP